MYRFLDDYAYTDVYRNVKYGFPLIGSINIRMDSDQDFKLNPVTCNKCHYSEGKVKVESFQENWQDHIIVENYLICPTCGGIIDYDIEYF